jgi:hypothetical protein
MHGAVDQAETGRNKSLRCVLVIIVEFRTLSSFKGLRYV